MAVYYVQLTSSGSLPAALADLSLTQNGVLVTEVGVSAVSLTTSARLFVDSGAGTDSGSGFVAVNLSSANGNAGLASQAGVPDAVETTAARLFVERTSNPLSRDTGIAIVNGNSLDAKVALTLVGVDGSSQWGTLTLPANGPVAQFISEMFPGLSPQYQGVLTITSNVAIAPLTLRLTPNQRGDAIYSKLPVADQTHPPVGPLLICQIVDGGGYQTKLILLNPTDITATARIDCINFNGSEVGLPLD